MISYIDIAFIAVAVLLTAVGAARGLVVSLISMARFILIVPASYLAAGYIEPYVPESWFADKPDAVKGVVLFLSCLIILMIITSIIIGLLVRLQKKKGMPLRHTNALLGGVFGLVKAAAAVLVICLLIGSLSGIIPQGSSFAKAVESSYAVKYVNEIDFQAVTEVIG